MAINLERSITVPPAEQKEFMEIWLSAMQIVAPVHGKCRIHAVVDVARTNADGTKETLPTARKDLLIEDFFSDATEKELAVMYQLVELIKARLKI
jgi:hypothetical protein